MELITTIIMTHVLALSSPLLLAAATPTDERQTYGRFVPIAYGSPRRRNPPGGSAFLTEDGKFKSYYPSNSLYIYIYISIVPICMNLII